MFSAAVDGAVTSGRTGDAAVMSPFDVTFQNMASGGQEAAAQPPCQIARQMSLDLAGCSRDCVKTWWRSLSFGDPGNVPQAHPEIILKMERVVTIKQLCGICIAYFTQCYRFSAGILFIGVGVIALVCLLQALNLATSDLLDILKQAESRLWCIGEAVCQGLWQGLS